VAKVDFFRWHSMLHMKKHQMKKEGQKVTNLTPKEIYWDLIRYFQKRNDIMSILAIGAENQWFDYGTPYYKVWPGMSHALGRASIDIDGKYLHLPFPSYEICLPKSPVFQETPDSPALCSLLVHKEDYLEDLQEDKKRILSGMPGAEVAYRGNEDRLWTLIVHYQLENDNLGWYYRMPIKEGKTLSEQFETSWGWDNEKYKNLSEYEPGKDFALKLIKIAIGVAFFGVHAHEMILEDIPIKLIEKYHRAKKENNESEAKRILEKSKRLGHFGWKVGSEVSLPMPLVKHINEEGQKERKGELTFGHIRSGHLRLQQMGPKENPHHELIFIAPTTVRPDLPLRDVRGFRIEDKLLRTKSSRD
jgi:hypothetical protein